LDLRSVSIVLPRVPVGLRAMLSSAGHECRRCPERYEWDGRRRGPAEFGLLQITLAGRGELVYDGCEHTLHPGTAMALRFPHAHRYRRPRSHDWRFIYVCLYGSEAMRLWSQAIEIRGPVWPIHPHQPLFRSALEICRRALNNQIGDAYTASHLAYGLALEGLHHATRDPVSDTAQRPAAVQRAIDLVRTRFADPLGVDDLASVAELSRYHFARVFKKSEGVSPSEFLRRHRLNVAVRKLQITTDTVKSIAQATGFCDASHLTKSLQAAYGVAPAVIRQQGMYGVVPSFPDAEGER
jgi:AraC-like DNA-binding protein